MKKLLILVVLVVLFFPVIMNMLPKPITAEKIETEFAKAGLVVAGIHELDAPNMEAVQQFSMTINGDPVEIYRYDDEGKIAVQLEYQKPDAGVAIAEAWNLSEKFGAAKPKKATPSSATRNGMHMVVVTSEDGALRQKVVAAFRSL